MPRSRYTVLVVEADPWIAGLVEEAFAELDEQQYRRVLPGGFRVYRAGSIEDALEWLEDPAMDLVLLDPDLPDSSALHSYLSLRLKAPDVPIVMLLDPAEESLGISAVREGAQDYLLKDQLDLIPLARAVRYAMERSTTATAIRNMPAGDSLTGLLNRPGFLMLGQQVLDSAARWSRPVSLYVVELRRGEEMTGAVGRQVYDMLILETAEFLRGLSKPGDILGRLSPDRMALLSLDAESPDLALACAEQLVLQCVSVPISTLGGLPLVHFVKCAEQSLCDNVSEGLKLAS